MSISCFTRTLLHFKALSHDGVNAYKWSQSVSLFSYMYTET